MLTPKNRMRFLSPSELQQPKSSLPFTWMSHQLPYLGVQLTASITDFFAANFLPLLKQVTNLMSQWSSLSLSWMGVTRESLPGESTSLKCQYYPNSSYSNVLHMGRYQAPRPQIYALSSQTKRRSGNSKLLILLLHSATRTFTQVSCNKGSTNVGCS